ncbi:TonB-dependent receptor domain-containing protein [Vulcanimicrobium alpinum]|nr:TonB-dependent receptor [Vulcanimicrobium alpinum]
MGLFALAVGPLSTAAALAQTAPIVAQNAPAAAAQVTGTVADSAGSPLAGATVIFRGARTYAATTDARGAFSVPNPAPGIYTVTASHPGYTAASESDFAIVAGQPNTLSVRLNAATLSSLQTIGRVSVNRRSTFNSTPASVQNVSAQTYIDQGQLQVQRVLDQTPGIVIDHPGTNATNASPGAITFPSIRGGLGFETASLIDGHPLAVGNFGDYVTTFLNSDVLANSEIVKGPGANSPEVNYAIGGTINFRTLEPTRKPAGQVKFGIDSFGGTFSNFRYTGTTTSGKLGWALDYALNGTPGPVNNQPGYVTLSSGNSINGQQQSGFTTNPPPGAANNGIQNNPLYYSTSLVACCLPVSQTYTNKTELVKLRYNASQTTAFTASYLGSQTYTDQNGNHLYQFGSLFTPGAAYSGGIPTGQPVNTWQSVFFPPNEYEINNEPIFQAEIRTALRNDNILARYYAASINRLQYNALQNPTDTFTQNLNLSGTVSLCPPGSVLSGGKCGPAGGPYTVTPVSTAFNDQNAIVGFTNSGGVCGNAQTGFIGAGTLNGAGAACGSAANPFTYYLSPQYFRAAEEDKLHGFSFEYDHPFGETGNLVSLSYDQTKSRTYAYDYRGAPTVPGVPDGANQTFRTILLRVNYNATDRLNVLASAYDNLYQQVYSTNSAVRLSSGQTVFNPFLTFTASNYSHFDGRLALTYRLNPNAIVRASAGSAIAPPYLNLLNRTATSPVLSADKTYYTNTAASQDLRPETSFGYDLGTDIRLFDGQTILTSDVYRTTLQNQFITSLFSNGCTDGTSFAAFAASGQCPNGFSPLYSSQVHNIGHARYEGLELAVTRDPAVGFGFKAQGALLRAYPYDLPPCFYATNLSCNVATNLAIISGVNFQNSGTGGSPGSFNSVSNHAEPYAQGYAEGHYRTPNGGYLSFGEQFYGKNNSLNVPPFWVANANLRLPLGGLSAQTSLGFNVDNLFNAYPNAYITPFAGTAVPLVNGKLGLTNQNVIGPRNVRISITKNFGG